MTTEELELRVKELEEENEKLKMGKTDFKLLTNRYNCDVYTLDSDGRKIEQWKCTKDSTDECHIIFSNMVNVEYYQSIVRPLLILAKIATERNNGWHPDRRADIHEPIWYIDIKRNEYEKTTYTISYTTSAVKTVTVYFRTEKTAKEALNKMIELGVWEC